MKLFATALAVLVVTSCSTKPKFEGEPYGEPLTLEQVTEVSDILARPQEYVGKRVLIEGVVKEVCDTGLVSKSQML